MSAIDPSRATLGQCFRTDGVNVDLDFRACPAISLHRVQDLRVSQHPIIPVTFDLPHTPS